MRVHRRPGRGTCAIALWIAAVPNLVQAASWTVKLDPGTSSIGFVLGATLHQVHGTLRLEEGTLQIDPETGEIQGTIRVDATTAETGNTRRDRKMHEKVLESARFPEIVLVPDHLEPPPGSAATMRFDLVGTLRIHGGDHPVTLSIEAQIDGDTITARSEFQVPYVEWGMEDPSVFLLRVDKFVTVTVEAHGTIRR